MEGGEGGRCYVDADVDLGLGMEMEGVEAIRDRGNKGKREEK